MKLVAFGGHSSPHIILVVVGSQFVPRGVYSDYRVNFKLVVSSRFKDGSCVHVAFYIIINLFLSRVKLGSIVSLDKCLVFRSVLNASSLTYLNKSNNVFDDNPIR